jgi:uncharacterized protein
MKNMQAKKSLSRLFAGSGSSPFLPVLFGLLILFILLPASLLSPARAQDPAAFRFDDYVVDRAGLLRPAEKQELASLLADFDQKTTNQFLVVILPSLPPGTSLELYSLELAEAAKAGRAGKDNGLLLLILRDDRKIRIEIGTGLEEKITDSRAGRVIREILAPAFQRDEYYPGIKAALLSLMNRVDPSYAPAAGGTRIPGGSQGSSFWPMLIILLLVIFFSYLNQRRLYKRGYTQTAFGPVVFRHGGFRGFSGGSRSGGFRSGGFRGGGGGFRGGGASGGW